jgi:hypothetical protein
LDPDLKFLRVDELADAFEEFPEQHWEIQWINPVWKLQQQMTSMMRKKSRIPAPKIPMSSWTWVAEIKLRDDSGVNPPPKSGSGSAVQIYNGSFRVGIQQRWFDRRFQDVFEKSLSFECFPVQQEEQHDQLFRLWRREWQVMSTRKD